MHRFRSVLLILGLIMAQGSSAVALVLRDGTVLDYGRMAFGDEVDGDRQTRQPVARDPEISRMALPAHAAGIDAVIVDSSAERVYLMLQLPVGQPGVLVLRQETLQPVGFLSGIVDVTVPRHPGASHVFLHRVVSESPGADPVGAPVAAMQGLPTRIERISRRSPERLSGLRLVNPRGALLACDRVRGRGYPGHTSVDDLPRSLTPKRRKDLGAVLETRNRELATRGYVADCWADGTLLRVSGDAHALQRCAIERQDGTLGPWRALMRGEGRCDAMAELPGIVVMGGRIVDLATGTESEIRDLGQPVHFQSGASSRAYLGLRDAWVERHSPEAPGRAEHRARVGALRVVSVADRTISVDVFPMGPAIDRVIALRAADDQSRNALPCDDIGTPMAGRHRGARATEPPECLEAPSPRQDAVTPEDEALSNRLPAIDIVGVIDSPVTLRRTGGSVQPAAPPPRRN